MGPKCAACSRGTEFNNFCQGKPDSRGSLCTTCTVETLETCGVISSLLPGFFTYSHNRSKKAGLEAPQP